MTERPLILRIEAAKGGDQGEMLALIEKFEPLLKKHARLLKYEDAFNDMQLEFIEWITYSNAERLKTLTETILLAYLKTSMYHARIKYSKKASAYRKLHKLHIEMDDAELYLAEIASAVSDEYVALEYEYLNMLLLPHEAETIILHHLEGYSVAEIACLKHVSRMSAHRWYKSALMKLRKDVSVEKNLFPCKMAV